METDSFRQGQTYHTADGGVTKNKGEKTVTMYSERGEQFRAQYQITDVTRPLNSISRVCDQRKNVMFSLKRVDGSSITRLVGIRGSLGNMECTCCTHGSMIPQLRNACDGQTSLFRGRSAKVLRFRRIRGVSGLCKTLWGKILRFKRKFKARVTVQ